MKIDGVVTPKVVHSKKKVHGKWVNPKYFEKETITMASGYEMTVMKETQYIDGCWRILRKEMKTTSKHDTKSVIELVKAAQWKTWHQGEDLWLAAGEAVQRCQYRP